MNLILLGPPGGGKGTQSKFLEKQFGLEAIVTGSLIREAIASSSEIGERAKGFVSKGRLVPDEIVVQLIKEKIKLRMNDFILDGFPRNVRQAVFLDEILSECEIKIDYIVSIGIKEKEIVSRLTGRRVCRDCGLNYHIVTKIPRVSAKCDKCDGELFERDDDKEEVIKERIRVFNDMTKELVGYYKSRGIVKNVDGAGSECDVSKRILVEIS